MLGVLLYFSVFMLTLKVRLATWNVHSGDFYASAAVASANVGRADPLSDEEDLQRALQVSRQQALEQDQPPPRQQEADLALETSEEEQIRRAIEASLQDVPSEETRQTEAEARIEEDQQMRAAKELSLQAKSPEEEHPAPRLAGEAEPVPATGEETNDGAKPAAAHGENAACSTGADNDGSENTPTLQETNATNPESQEAAASHGGNVERGPGADTNDLPPSTNDETSNRATADVDSTGGSQSHPASPVTQLVQQSAEPVQDCEDEAEKARRAKEASARALEEVRLQRQNKYRACAADRSG